MPPRRTAGVLAVTTLAIASLLGSATSAQAAVPKKYKNCTNLHHYYPHGVGKSGAKDRTSGKRVTSFKHSTKAYKAAVKANKRLDADKDGIACEKR